MPGCEPQGAPGARMGVPERAAADPGYALANHLAEALLLALRPHTTVSPVVCWCGAWCWPMGAGLVSEGQKRAAAMIGVTDSEGCGECAAPPRGDVQINQVLRGAARTLGCDRRGACGAPAEATASHATPAAAPAKCDAPSAVRQEGLRRPPVELQNRFPAASGRTPT